MSVFKVLPKHTSIQSILDISKFEREFDAKTPEGCNEIKFDDLTNNLVNNSHRANGISITSNVMYKNSKVKVTTHQTIKDKLPDCAKELLKHPGVCIAGGSIVNIIRGDNLISDYDVFFYGLNLNQVKTIINEWIKHCIKKSNPKIEIYMYKNVLNVMIYNCGLFQFILVQYKTPQTIIQHFDIGACQVCITDKDLYITDYARFCMYNNIIIFDLNQSVSYNYDVRILKYHTNKNFSVLFPNLTKSDIAAGFIIEKLEVKEDAASTYYSGGDFVGMFMQSMSDTKFENQMKLNINDIDDCETINQDIKDCMYRIFHDKVKSNKDNVLQLHTFCHILDTIENILKPTELNYFIPENGDDINRVFNKTQQKHAIQKYTELPQYSKEIVEFVL